mgnify:CR=1 FL=1
MQNGLALTSIYGGCAIDYQELTDPQEKDWANALAKATGFEEKALLAARDNHLKGQNQNEPNIVEPFPSCKTTYSTLREIKGVYLPPAKATRRAIISAKESIPTRAMLPMNGGGNNA